MYLILPKRGDQQNFPTRPGKRACVFLPLPQLLHSWASPSLPRAPLLSRLQVMHLAQDLTPRVTLERDSVTESQLKLVLERLKQRGCDWGARTGPSAGARGKPHLRSCAEVRRLRGKSGTER